MGTGIKQAESKAGEGVLDTSLGDSERLLGSNRRKDVTISVPIDGQTWRVLREIADSNGRTVAAVAREGLGMLIHQYKQARQLALQKMADNAPGISRQATQIFADLPPGEVGLDDPISLHVRDDGSIVIRADRTGNQYWADGHAAVRAVFLDDGRVELTSWRRGVLVGRDVRALPRGASKDVADTYVQ